MFRVPRATYRLQFNAGFTFDDARRVAGYLADLGVTDVYASPILRARKGSAHGYDVVDASALNPELGSDDDFNQLDAELKRNKLGFLLDIVPNHMAASAENAWWMSVLENGQHSRFLHYFDIDWSPVTAQGKTVTKVLLPILGRPYGEVLEAQEIRLSWAHDGFRFDYFEHRLPLAPESYRLILRECLHALPTEGVGLELRELGEGDETVPNSKFLKETIARIYDQDESFRTALDDAIAKFNGTQGDSASFSLLDKLLDAQWYRLAYWRIASEKINYRRFFDVTDLVGVRVENPEVFEARNRRTLELIAEGKVTGLRIDHIDGLYDPIGHMQKLQSRLADTSVRSREPGAQEKQTADAAEHRATDTEHRAPDTEHRTPDTEHRAPDTEHRTPTSFYIVVEKILESGEELPRDFPVSGTTGYDFLNVVNNVFVDGEGLAHLTQFYREFTGTTRTFADSAYRRKKQVINELFPGEMRAMGKQISGLAMLDRNGRDFAPAELSAALTEITACLEVYRTYTRAFEVSDADRVAISNAVAHARKRARGSLDDRIFTFLERVLLLEPPSYAAEQRESWLAFVMRWQQFTGRVMAKGVEDTAFYNYNRLVSLNEVGGEPGRDPKCDALAELHERNERIARDWPDTLNATSTHDTKRSEDVRARINVLSEFPQSWEREVRRWSKTNEPLRVDGIPDPNVELMMYQNLIGFWPLDEADLDTVPERFRQFLEKAAREAKTHTSWIAPNADYEQKLLKFSDAIIASDEFRSAFTRMQKRVAFYGFLNALSQLILKVTSPGVPDFYQGTELWDLSLVDPDNRRPVDYDSRRAVLAKLKAAEARGALDRSTLLRRWFDGRVKMFVTWKTLDARNRNEEVFRRGGYRALREGGPNVCAFTRGDDQVLVAVPRFVSRLVEPRNMPVGEVWSDQTLEIGGRWRNAFTGETVEGERLALRDVFATFPVAVLERE
jgi:(1->4)-alpha-D-glucan 1-alpha-D-glucosylmutase